MQLSDKKVIVIGAGVGGLASALALARRGAQVNVLEQATEISDIGAGVQISPNGMAVLKALGLRNAILGRALTAEAVVLHNYSNAAEVVRLVVTRQGQRNAYQFIHRADLIDCLLTAVREVGVRVRLLQQVAEVQPAIKPWVKLANRRVESGDLIIAADGVRSSLRSVLNGPSEPLFSGQVAWRALVPQPADSALQARIYMAPGRHLVSYPLRAGQLLNLVAVQERINWAAEGWQHRDDPAHLQRAFADFDPSVLALLRRVEDVHLWGLFHHPVASVWHREHTVLLGDAAHPMLPFLAQGTNMALEDAWVLAASLAEAATLEVGLAHYQERRAPRVARVAKAASRNAWKYHLRNPALRGVAHFALKTLGRVAPRHLIGQYDWLYNHDVTQI